MSLSDLWKSSRTQLEDKHVQQIIAFGGTGELKDGVSGSMEFRELLSHVPAELLARYVADCLEGSFPGSGFALQDVVNQVGRRLGFTVEDGRYRGTTSAIGFDGLWILASGHAIVVEVKTTDAYRIDLGSVAGYRRALAQNGRIREDRSSVLIVVGRQDTGDLEAQPSIVQKISDILIPREFTRLDEIVDVVFSTAEQAAQPEPETVAESTEEAEGTPESSEPPANFHAACIARVEKDLGCTLVRRTRSGYSSPDQVVSLVCAVSRVHRHFGHPAYWFAFHPHQLEFIEGAERGYLVLGCGSPDRVLAIPVAALRPWLEHLWQTHRGGTYYWHFRIHDEKGGLMLDRKGGEGRFDVASFLVKSAA
jgi:hypothetical protein